MPNVRNADSGYIARSTERIQELEDELEFLARTLGEESAAYKKVSKELTKELEKLNKTTNSLPDKINTVVNKISRVFNGLSGDVSRVVDQYVGSIESLSYSLNGSLRSYFDVTENLNKVLGGQNIVNQSKAFDNLTKVINSGIINNAEQKAFLQTLSQDLGMKFRVDNDTIRQLIRIQGEDSTANRMAIEYSLNEFLVQNYQTGEYIRQGFERVSNALLQSQSTMSAAMAASYEATVQTWMGSLYSVGLNGDTISQLASAIDAVGSGNIKNLGSGASNLVLMGAARAGLDYGELLNRGFQGNDVNRLMSGITGYISEMSGNSSNVVMSQMADLFGLQLSDIMALRNNNITVAGGANADANEMLRTIGGLVPSAVRISNAVQNFKYGWGANVATDDLGLTSYMFAREIIEPLGGFVNSIGDAIADTVIGSTVGGVIEAVGTVMGASSLIPIFGANIASIIKDPTSLFDQFSGMLNTSRGESALSIFNALAGNYGSGSSVVISGSGTSGSMAFSRDGGGGGLLGNMRSSLNDLGIEETTGDEITVDEHISNIDNTVQSILDRLGSILNAMPSNTTSGVTYGERSYSGAAFV